MLSSLTVCYFRFMKPPRRLLRELHDPIHLAGATYQHKWTQCNNPRCPRRWHGPYWYAFFKVGKRTRCKYLGKELPPAVIEEFHVAGDEAEIAREAVRLSRGRGRTKKKR